MEGTARSQATITSPLSIVEAELINFKGICKFSKKRMVLMFPEGLDPVINRYIRFLVARVGLESDFICDQGAERVVVYSQENFRTNPPKFKLSALRNIQTEALQPDICDKPEDAGANALCKSVDQIYISHSSLNVERELPPSKKCAISQKDEAQATGSGLTRSKNYKVKKTKVEQPTIAPMRMLADSNKCGTEGPTNTESPAAKSHVASKEDDGETSISNHRLSSLSGDPLMPFDEQFNAAHENELVLEIVELENSSPGPSPVPSPNPQLEEGDRYDVLILPQGYIESNTPPGSLAFMQHVCNLGTITIRNENVLLHEFFAAIYTIPPNLLDGDEGSDTEE